MSHDEPNRATREYDRHIRAAAEYLITAEEHNGIIGVRRGTIRRTGPKVGNNDPCPCRSGKKFKRCCRGS